MGRSPLLRGDGRSPRSSGEEGSPPPTPASAGTGGSFPIIGIGASAGGLEALEELLRHVPGGSGLAFVVVQHLDPSHKGLLPEILQRTTPMRVVEVRDRMRVRPDGVYVIPPNRDMSLLRGTLHLTEPTVPRGFRLPIDFFFRSLASDRRERSIGVVLSGMGSDGTLGLRAIKARSARSRRSPSSCARGPGKTSPSTSRARSTAVWSGGWESTGSTGSRRTSSTCRRTRRRSTFSFASR